MLVKNWLIFKLKLDTYLLIYYIVMGSLSSNGLIRSYCPISARIGVVKAEVELPGVY